MQWGAGVAGSREAALAPSAGPSPALFEKLSPGPGKPATEVQEHQRARIYRAVVELVAERGYDAVTVRELAKLASVSTRTFYQHYASKEECFLRIHELIARRLIRRVLASQTGQHEWQQCLRSALDPFLDELARDPRAARILLVEAYAAGPAAYDQVRRTVWTFEARIGESFSRAAAGVAVPPPVLGGIAAGVVCVARSRVLAGQGAELPGLIDGLMEWALAYRSAAAAELVELDRRCLQEGRTAKAQRSSAGAEEDEGRLAMDGRALILSAAGKLAATPDHRHDLTVARICAAAGATRSSFHTSFGDMQACLVAAFEARADAVFGDLAQAKAPASSWEAGVCQAVAALCAEVARDPIFANLCFNADLALGSAAIECRDRLLARIAYSVYGTAPGASAELAEKAAAGAAWSVLRHCIASGRASRADGVAATLSFLLLAPSLGAEAAVGAIRTELPLNPIPIHRAKDRR
jgi:AcrR family transcriptional regulator